MGRRQRTNVPVKPNSLKPRAISHKKFKEIRQEVQDKMKENFDKCTKKLQRLQSGQTVGFQVEPSGRWRRGTVKKPQGINSYVIETERGTYRRNRRHIRKTYEDIMPEQSEPKDNCHKMVLFKMMEIKFKVNRAKEHYIRPEVDAQLNQTASTLKTLFEQ